VDSDEVRRQWAERSGEYSPEYYAHYGPDEKSESVRTEIGEYLDRDAAVLELGCSSGRHLAHLLEDGYENLTGIEINPDALDVMEDVYPELAQTGTFYADTMESVVEEFEDGQFDAVYSVETLQHVHEDDADWLFAELARITDELLITVENEGEADFSVGDETDKTFVDGEFPLYFRDWGAVFSECGLTEVNTSVGSRCTMRTFRTE
jgi:SAM-dependent methyltransferase